MATRDQVDMQKRAIRNALDTHSVITFEDKRALVRWHQAVQELESEGFLETELLPTGVQSTALEVRRKKK